MIGTSLIHYRLTARLGAGGMGEVYRATDTKLGREVAIKVLPEQFSESRESVARFEREAKVLASLDHPSIAAIYGFEEANDIRFLVLQLVEGETLAERLERGPLPPRTALQVCRQIAEALETAHEKGVIHRDLKPANVKITPDEKVKVLDFGIAKGLIDEPSAQKNAAPEDTPTVLTASTRPGAILGTPAYMSPEQARGEPVDKRSDIWSFGCLLYECLSGTKLFEAETPIDSLHAVLHRDPDWSALPAETPTSIQRLLQRCLARDPKKRLRDIRDASVEIEAAISEPVSLSSTMGRAVAGVTSEPKPKWVGHSKIRFFPATLAAVGVLIIAVVSWWAYPRLGPSQESNPPSPNKSPGPSAGAVNSKSVAVLPFVNMSSDKENEYLSDGITEDLCTALAQVRGLRVPARTSCFVFKGKTDDIQKIGQQLRVANVLEGSVSQSGKKLRISAQLISVADGFHLWATNYDREVSDLLALRSEIAQQVVASLRVQLLPGETQQLAKEETENPEAHRLYLLGRSFWNQRTGDGLKKALGYFEQALGQDPNYALAQVGLADCYLLLPEYAGVPSKEAMSKASAAALTALKLDDTLGEAHAALAYVRRTKWDWQGAESEFRRAIELTPNYPTAHHWYSIHLRDLGRFDEARREIRRAQELDPLSPIINVNVGRIHHFQGHDDQAIAAYRAVLELNSNFPLARHRLGESYLMKRMYREAITEFQTIRASAGNHPFGLGDLGYAYGISGRVNEAGKVLDDLTGFLQQGYEVQSDIALVYHGLGDRQRALDWLEKTLEAQTRWMPDLRYDPLWQDLHSEPRFVALLQEMGLDK